MTFAPSRANRTAVALPLPMPSARSRPRDQRRPSARRSAISRPSLDFRSATTQHGRCAARISAFAAPLVSARALPGRSAPHDNLDAAPRRPAPSPRAGRPPARPSTPAGRPAPPRCAAPAAARLDRHVRCGHLDGPGPASKLPQAGCSSSTNIPRVRKCGSVARRRCPGPRRQPPAAPTSSITSRLSCWRVHAATSSFTSATLEAGLGRGVALVVDQLLAAHHLHQPPSSGSRSSGRWRTSRSRRRPCRNRPPRREGIA